MAVVDRFPRPGLGIGGLAAPFSRQRQHDLAAACAAGQVNLGAQDLVGGVFQNKAQRARIVQKAGIAKAAGPDQVGLIRQRDFKATQRRVDQPGHHGGVGAGRLAGGNLGRFDAADGLHLNEAGQNGGGQHDDAQPFGRAVQNGDQRAFRRQIDQFGQRTAVKRQAAKVECGFQMVTRRPCQGQPPAAIRPRPACRHLGPCGDHLAANDALPCFCHRNPCIPLPPLWRARS